MNGPDIAHNFLILSLIFSTLTSTVGVIRRTRLRLLFARRRRRRRLILCILLLLQRRQRGNTRRAWSWNRQQYFFNQLLTNSLPDSMWKEHLRVNRRTFERICQIVGPELSKKDTHLRRAIPLRQRIAIALLRLATGNSYLSSGLIFGLPKSTSNTIKTEFCKILKRKAPEFIKFPCSEDETMKVIEGFEEIGSFPQVAGAIDGSHIKIKKPLINSEDYRCRKLYHSIVLQAVVDSYGRFRHVSTGYPGSIHDARILRMSSFYRDVENEDILCSPIKLINGRQVKPLIIGDPAYKLTSWLMKPYPQIGALSNDQRIFNKKLSSVRVVVEQAFGMLKGRWRCLLETLNEETSRVPTTIVACCVLHNICVDMADDTPIDVSDDDDNGAPPLPGHNVNSDGDALREHLKRYLK